MTKNDFLEAFQAFTVDVTKDLILPVQQQKSDKEPPVPRAPEVHIMALEDYKTCKKKAPYIIHQIATAKDWWQPAQPGQRAGYMSRAEVRSIFAVYNENAQEGQLALLEMMERVRINLLRLGTIGRQFMLEYEAGVEYLVYPNNIQPFYAGEMFSTWKLPPVEREVNYGKQGYSNIQSGGPGLHSAGCPENGRHYGPKE